MALMARKGQVKPNDRPSPGPKGNTEGPVLPETSPNASGAGNSAPPPKPPEEKKGWWKSWGSDVTHGVLDVVGVIPVVGEPFNLIGAGVYVLEGDYVSAGLDLAAMWPAGGQAATVTKYGVKGGKVVVEQVEKKAAKEAEEQAAKQLDHETAKKTSGAAPPSSPPPPSGGRVPGNPACRTLAAAIYAQVPEVASRFTDLMMDKLGLFKLTVNPDGTKGSPHPSLPKGSGTWHGHIQQLEQKQRSLRENIKAYDAAKCTQPKIVKSVRDLAYHPVPATPGGLPGYPFTSLPK